MAVKKEFRISKGYTLMTDFLSKKIYVRFPYLHMDLLSLNSLYSFSLLKMAKSGLQRTPSMYDEDDIWATLLKRYGLKSLKNLKSDSKKKYILDNSTILHYAMSTTDNAQFKEDLKLMYTSIKLRENIKELESLLSSTVDNNLPRCISPTAYIKKGHIQYRPKYDLTSSLIISLTQETQINTAYYTSVYYKFLTKYCWDELDPKKMETWSFIEGKTRNEESEYLESILNGDIKATSKEGIYIQDKYFFLQNVKGEDFMFMETIEERRKILDSLYRGFESKNIEVKGLTDYCVYFRNKPVEEKKDKFIGLDDVSKTQSELKSSRRKRVKHKVRIVTGYYVFDTDEKEYLPVINRILGISGEFSREPQYDGQLSYQLINNDYEYEHFYRVEEDPCIYLDDLDTYDYRGTNSEIISTLVETGKLSTNLRDIQRIETEKDDVQVSKYWDECLKYEGERLEYDNKSQHKV